MTPRAPLLALAMLAFGCADAAAPVSVRLTLPEDPRCRPAGALGEIVVEALGDFPASDARTIELLDPAAGPRRIDRFPPSTRLLAVTAFGAEWAGLGLRRAASGDVPLLPRDRPCAAQDPLLTTPGRAFAALPDGSLVLAGGRAELGFGDRRLARYALGDALATPIGDELVERRFEPSVAVAGERVFVIGGGADATGGGLDTFEVFDAARRLTAAPRSLGGPRREAGVVPLGASAVLVVGGRVFPEAAGELGAPLASVLRIDASSFAVRAMAPLPVGRARPRVLRLDDGGVVLVGGRGPGGGDLTEVLVFDPEQGGFVSSGIRLAAFLGPAQAVALPGARAVAFGADLPTQLELLERVPPEDLLRPNLRRTRIDLAAALPAMTGARAAALPDGRLLLTGTDGEGAPRAFALDLGALSVDVDDPEGPRVVRAGSAGIEAWPLRRAPERLVSLADGLVAELDAEGAFLRRPPLATLWGSAPSTLFLEDLRASGPGQWAQEGSALVALEDEARLELPALRFAALEVELQDDRALELLFRPAGALATVVAFNAVGDEPGLREVAVGACTTEVPRDAPVRIAREGRSVRVLPVEAGAFEGRGCPEPELGGDFARFTDTEALGLGVLVGVGLRARRGTRIEGFRVRRVESE